MKRLSQAFTLIELLVVIAIISILATSLIPKIKGMQDKAKYARVEKDFDTLRTAIFMAQTNTNKILPQITLTTCTHCPCRLWGSYAGVNLSDYPVGHACRIAWISALRKIETAAGLSSGALASVETDPRGSPYIFDENETNACTTKIYLTTFGVDGYLDRQNQDRLSDDDRSIIIAPAFCPGSY